MEEGIQILEDLAQLSQNAYDVTMELAMAYRQNKNYKQYNKYLGTIMSKPNYLYK